MDRAPARTPPALRLAPAGVSLALALVVAAVYAPTVGHDFVGFDDRALIVENRALDAGLTAEGVGWAFTTRADGNWIPLTWLSFLVDEEVHGRSARGVHATNVALHALATALCFLAFRRLTGRAGPSAFVAAVFGLHPLHVESVAWAIERKDVLSGALFFATLWAYGGWAARPGALRGAAVLGLFVLGLLAKPMLVTLPCVLLLLDAWPLGRLGSAAAVRRAVLEKLPLFAASAAASVATLRGQAGAGATEALALDVAARFANAAVAAATYLRKAVAPVDLAIFYPHPGDALPAATVAASAALLLVLSAVALRQWRARPFVAVGWLWYLGMLVPVLGLVQVGEQAMADRYTYLPLVGATLPLAFGGAELARRGGAWRAGVAAVAAIALVACALATSHQLGFWRDGAAVFERALAVEEANAVAHNGLAVERLAEGRLAEAREHLERAVALDPGLVDARVNLGVVLLREGDPEAALPHLRRGLGLPPGRRADVHARLASAELAAGRPGRALAEARAGLALRDDAEVLHATRGIALAALGRDAEAAAALARAEALGLDDAGVHAAFAGIEERAGRASSAAERYRRALAGRPDDAALANNLAWLLATGAPGVRRPAEAVRWAERAAALRPADPAVLDTLAVAHHAAGDLDAALAANARAVRAARDAGLPDQASAFEARAAAWRAEGKGGP